MKITNIFLFFLIQGLAVSALAQKDNPVYSRAVEEKIKQVENNLCGWVKMNDSNTVWNLRERMKFYRVKGLSIAVVHNYQIEWARGYGWADEGEGRPVTINTVFQAGSISKSLNGVGVLKLVQLKKLSLNDDINKYLRSWKFPYDSLSKHKIITLGNLLSHTGGLSVHGFPGYEIGDSIPTIDQVLDGQRPANTEPVRSVEEPSKDYIYSGGGVTISQLMVTDVTGKPYDEYMWQNVLKPMGMYNSSYTQPPLKNPHRATGYLWGGKEVKGKYHIYPEQAAAGLWTTPTDIGKYIIETQLSLKGKSAKVLSPATTALRLTEYIDTITNGGNGIGLGLFITFRNKDSVKYFFHGGSDIGFLSRYGGSFEGGNGLAVMINADNPDILISEIINSVAKVYDWPYFYKPIQLKTIEIPRDSMQLYGGTYISKNDTISIKAIGNKLFYASNFMNLDHFEQLYFISRDSAFLYEERGIAFSINRDGNGKAATLTLNHGQGVGPVFMRQQNAELYNRF